jgi:curli production assembly/transport component CsgG/holdfast attachment protein HfaB
MRRVRALAAVGLLGLGGCVAPATDGANYVTPLGSALASANPTAYSTGLDCLGRTIGPARQGTTFAVGDIADYTGKDEYYTGRPITQGAALMLISALDKAGLRQVERFDTAVAEVELQYANNKLLGDARGGAPYREILAGSIPGSDFFFVGGVTELNFNLFSGSADVLAGPAEVGGRLYVMNVGVDLRLVATRTLEIVDVVSFQQQVYGRELSAGFFEFLSDDDILDIGVGDRSQEPMQRAVRAIIERAALELVGGLYELNVESCLPERRAAAATATREPST